MRISLFGLQSVTSFGRFIQIIFSRNSWFALFILRIHLRVNFPACQTTTQEKNFSQIQRGLLCNFYVCIKQCTMHNRSTVNSIYIYVCVSVDRFGFSRKLLPTKFSFSSSVFRVLWFNVCFAKVMRHEIAKIYLKTQRLCVCVVRYTLLH